MYLVILTNHVGATRQRIFETRSEAAASEEALRWAESVAPGEGWTVTSVL